MGAIVMGARNNRSRPSEHHSPDHTFMYPKVTPYVPKPPKPSKGPVVRPSAHGAR